MLYFLCRLIPPRPTFPQDMTPLEAKAMADHAAYWAVLADRGSVIVFGPVADPNGSWGVAIAEVHDEAEIRALTAGDPVMKAALGMTYEILPMPRAVIGKRRG